MIANGRGQASGEAVILCCNTLEDELNLLFRETGLGPRVVWLEGGMHNQPDKLRDHINGTIREIGGGRVLMALGHCGGACAGLESGGCELVIPRTDDCVSLLMGSMARRQAAGRQAATYFLTGGWLRYTESLVNSFDKDSARFGPEKAERIYRAMLKHYKRFGFIETGAYDPGPEEEKIAPLAETLNIGLSRLAGDLGWLRRLLLGPWPPSEFIIVPPHSRLDADGWDWLGMAPGQMS